MKLVPNAYITAVLIVIAGASLAATGFEDRIKPEDQQHWCFQPIANPNLPQVRDATWCRNPIDQFILARLEQTGIVPSPEADRRTLIRRASLDLIGLPPTPEQVDAFLNDQRPDAWEHLIDTLLASPHYGERWGRLWLDVVRYAESDGHRQDAYRPHTWRYRDWVIRALNQDMPYDRFMAWQIAGDQLAPESPDAHIATGFLRLWPYEYNQRDVKRQWSEILNDVTDVTSDAFLGLSLGCSRCHDHKFDPILREDYFGLQAFFSAILPDDDLVAATPAQRHDYDQAMATWLDRTASIRDEIEAIRAPIRHREEKAAFTKFQEDIQAILAVDRESLTPTDRQIRDLSYRQLLETHAKVDSKIKDDARKRFEQLTEQLKTFEHLKPAALTPIEAVRDLTGPAPVTLIPGTDRAVEPRFLAVLGNGPAAQLDPSGRRATLARWMADPANPLTPRVITNRVWQQHFGVGLTSTSNDFGHQGEAPTHPELLDWLSHQLITQGWRLKTLHRLIMTSATYRQAADTPTSETARSSDPDNQLLWRMRVRRIESELIRDAMLAVSGDLDVRIGGASEGAKSMRRSVYLQQRRNQRPEFQDVFDGPDGFNSCARREVTTTAPQALLMLNAPWTIQRGEHLAKQLDSASNTLEQRIETAYQKSLSRPPSKTELAQAVAFITTQRDLISGRRANPIRLEAFKATKRRALSVRSNQPEDHLRLAPNPELPKTDFTIEAIIQLESMYEDASVRTIASRWIGHQSQPGWSFGVTSQKSRYQPGNLIFQFVGDEATGRRAYEVIASDLRIQIGRPYYVAASVKLADTTPSGITFYTRALDDPKAILESAAVAHQVTGGIHAAADLVIGGRHQIDRHTWHGLIGEVRLSKPHSPQTNC